MNDFESLYGAEREDLYPYMDYLDTLSPGALFLLSRKMDRDDLNSLSGGTFDTYDIIEQVWRKYGDYTFKQHLLITRFMSVYLLLIDDFGIMDLIKAKRGKANPWHNYYSPKEN